MKVRVLIQRAILRAIQDSGLLLLPLHVRRALRSLQYLARYFTGESLP